MGEVVEFPRIERNRWRQFAGELKRLKPGHDDAIDWVVADMEPRWELIGASGSFQTPANNPEANRIAQEMSEFSSGVIERARIQMFHLEFELYMAKFGGPPIGPLPDTQVTFEVPKPPKET